MGPVTGIFVFDRYSRVYNPHEAIGPAEEDHMTHGELQDWAARNGMRAAVVDINSLTNARERLSRLAEERSLDGGFVQRSLSRFTYLEKTLVSRPRAVIMLAIPRPAHLISFQFEDGERKLFLPPTYGNYSGVYERCMSQLRADFGLSIEEIELASAPFKSLAAMSGLIRYGRNNLGYIPGWGSFFQLMALVSSTPPDDQSELPQIDNRMLDRCRQCRACVKACPTGAITEARFLLHAERCYTMFSELPDPIPESMPVPTPRCIVGCMRCQEVCPENKGLLKYEHTGIVVSRLETDVMLKDPHEIEDGSWKSIEDKFAALGVSEDVRLFARNIRRAAKAAT